MTWSLKVRKGDPIFARFECNTQSAGKTRYNSRPSQEQWLHIVYCLVETDATWKFWLFVKDKFSTIDFCSKFYWIEVAVATTLPVTKASTMKYCIAIKHAKKPTFCVIMSLILLETKFNEFSSQNELSSLKIWAWSQWSVSNHHDDLKSSHVGIPATMRNRKN